MERAAINAGSESRKQTVGGGLAAVAHEVRGLAAADCRLTPEKHQLLL
jgi:hypothetical protein